MVDKIEENKVYKCIPKQTFSQEVYIGYLKRGQYTFIAIKDKKFERGVGENVTIDYRSNGSFTQQNTFEATPEEVQWFLKCVELSRYISLEQFRKLQVKEFNRYNI